MIDLRRSDRKGSRCRIRAQPTDGEPMEAESAAKVARYAVGANIVPLRERQ